MCNQLSRLEAVQCYLLDDLLGWEKKKKNLFSSLFISVLNNNGMSKHKFIKELELQGKEGRLRPQAGEPKLWHTSHSLTLLVPGLSVCL